MRARSFRWWLPAVGVLTLLAGRASAQINISNSPGRESISPRLAVDSQGNPHAVWVEKTGAAAGDVFYAKGSVAALQISAPVNLSQSNSVYCDTQEMCAIAIDGLDRVYVVWTEGWSAAASIKLRTCANGTWDAPVTVAAGLRFQAPRLAAGPQGNLYIVWWNNQWQIYSTARVNGIWESPRMISPEGLTAKMADIDLGTNIVGVAFAEKNRSVGDYYQTAYVQRGAGFNASWGPVVLVAPKAINQQHPAVRVDAADRAHVVWTDESGTRIVQYARTNGSGFTSPLAISPEGMLHYPFMSKQGPEIYAVWQVGNYGGGESIDYNVLGADGVWKGRREVQGSSGATYGDIAASPGNGILYFLWDTALGTTNSEIYGFAEVSTLPNPTLSVSRDHLTFGAVSGGPSTGSQRVLVANTGAGSRRWTATPSPGWVLASPASGTGAGLIDVGVNHAGLALGTYQGTVLIADPDAPQYSPKAITVTLSVIGSAAGAGPFGSFDTPTDQATVRGSVAVTGWALDDIGVQSVKIYRDPVAGEPGGQPVYIGDAVFVEGARPDVEAAFPGFPATYGAGWGYMLLSNFLPNQGNGLFTLRARAIDKEGRVAELGTKMIVADNAHDVLPFGAIDTPAQGGTASSNPYTNFGWALTQSPKSIPADGSTITVWVDGKPLGHPNYGHYRQDVATLFPGLANSNGAIGYFHLDTTAYPNGLHTIAWSVKDNGGNESGIGSRFFTILNTGLGIAQGLSPAVQNAGGDGDITRDRLSGYISDDRSPIFVRRGYDIDSIPEPVFPETDGGLIISIKELDRLEIWIDRLSWEKGVERGWALGPTGVLPASKERGVRGYRGYLGVGKDLRSLPAGSAIDCETGAFTWQPGPGFLGRYDLVFINERLKTIRRIEVPVLPKY